MRKITYETESGPWSEEYVLYLDGTKLQARFTSQPDLIETLFEYHNPTEIVDSLKTMLVYEINLQCDYYGLNQLNKHEQQQINDIIEQIYAPYNMEG